MAIVALVSILAWPLHTLLTAAALPDSAGLILIYRLGHHRLILDGGIALAALVLILAPRRVLRAVPYVLIVLLGIGSVSAEQYAAKQARLQQQTMLGPRKDWIDRSAHGPAGLLYGDQLQWPAVWESLFWNRKLEGVFALPGAKLIGPAPGSYVGLANDGTVLVAGRPLPQRYVASELGLLVNGTPIADAGTSPGGTVAPWRLWHLDGPLRLVGRTSGIQANGDIYRRRERPRLQLPRNPAADAARQAGRADQPVSAGKPLPPPEREDRGPAAEGAPPERPLRARTHTARATSGSRAPACSEAPWSRSTPPDQAVAASRSRIARFGSSTSGGPWSRQSTENGSSSSRSTVRRVSAGSSWNSPGTSRSTPSGSRMSWSGQKRTPGARSSRSA